MSQASEILDENLIVSAVTKVEAAATAEEKEQAERDGESRLLNTAKTLRLDRKAADAPESKDSPGWAAQAADALSFLRGTSKNTRVLTLLLEALTREHGWRGLAAGVRLYRRLVESCSDRIRPPLPSRYTNFFNAMKDPPRAPGRPTLGVWYVPLFRTRGGRRAWVEDLAAPPGTIDPAAISIDDVYDGLARFTADKQAAWFEEAARAAEEIKLLRAAIAADLLNSGSPPTFATLKLEEDIDQHLARAKELLAHARAASPIAVVPDSSLETSAGASQVSLGAQVSDNSRIEVRGPRNRAEAGQCIDAAARYFESADPHSPVSYRLRTAERWLERPLREVLAELLPDKAHLQEVLKGLGLVTANPSAGTAPAAGVPVTIAPAAGSAGAVPGSGQPAPANQASNGGGVADPTASQTVPSPGSEDGRPAGASAPLATPADRAAALKLIEAARRYLSDNEPHSLSNFPLASAAEIVNLSAVVILSRAITSDGCRNSLGRELGVPLVKS